NPNGEAPSGRVQIDADRAYTKLRLYLLQQRAMPAADVQNRLHRKLVVQKAFQDCAVVSQPPMGTRQIGVAALAHIFGHSPTIQDFGLAGTLSDVSSEYGSILGATHRGVMP